jgi:uncharacterized tellurite resistance protein B-like protein
MSTTDLPGEVGRESPMKWMDWIRRTFGKSRPAGPAGRAEADLGDARIAACALFLEMARADGEFNEEERARVLSILKHDYQISDDDAALLIRATDQELEESIDLWQFTRRINQSHSDEEKSRIIQLLWKIVYADGTLDKHERYLVHKLSKLLRLSHEELIEAKLKVIREDKARDR